MRCNPSARWGPGTTKDRQPDTESARQLKVKLEEMAKERAKQDTMWKPIESEEKQSLPVISEKNLLSRFTPGFF
jgi:hypothetical protein